MPAVFFEYKENLNHMTNGMKVQLIFSSVCSIVQRCTVYMTTI